MSNTIYTIGHSNHPPEKFLGLLKGAEIELLVDVRSRPYSRWAPYANPGDLKSMLEAASIGYLFLGKELGGRPLDPDCYDSQTGKPDYQAMQNRAAFRQGLDRLMEEMERHRVCIMCAEEDPSACHRNFLVADALRRHSVEILHIRATGQIQKSDEDLRKEKTCVGEGQLELPLRDDRHLSDGRPKTIPAHPHSSQNNIGPTEPRNASDQI